MAEVAILLKYDVASLGNRLLVFQNNIVVPPSSAEMCNFFFNISTLDYKTITLFQNVRNRSSSDVAPYPRTAGTLLKTLTYSMEKGPS